MTSDAKNLLYLFQRPTEPVFMPKGDDKSVVFEVPESYLIDRYKPLKNELVQRFGADESIPVKRISLPDLSIPLQLGRRENFSLFLPKHRKVASRLIEIFMEMRSLDDFISASVYCRDRVNPYLFIYALSVAILHRPETRHLSIPTLCEIFPDKYLEGSLFAKAKEEVSIVAEQGKRIPLDIPKDYTASDLDMEHRVAYFREDLGVNLHHWHWHLVYPSNGPLNIVKKDRRGELFYYMHQQIMARYNFERFCNRLGRTKRLNNFRAPMEEGYFPKLESLNAGTVWPARGANSYLHDVDREVDQTKFDIDDLERWRDRLFDAIHKGAVVDDTGKSIELNETVGIDILGNIVETCFPLNINKNYYGDLHNMGHMAISYCHDPDFKNLETFGVMGDVATAMRDPIFYRWHSYINDIFQEHKNTLPRYPPEKLNFPGIKVNNIDVISESGKKNQFVTFWQQSELDLSRGLDFAPTGSLYARFIHLQHEPFTYNITVENENKTPKKGTVRIFLAPRFDERGLRMTFRDQKGFFAEMDKFSYTLKPGRNTITRKSSDSSVTIPFERTFRNLNANSKNTNPDEVASFNFCGCGWPHHMLVPKGTPEGYQCELFAMVSDYADDEVPMGSGKTCSDAASYCGIRDSLYPDKRSMGYPFDRQAAPNVIFLKDFMTLNMRVQFVSIVFTGKTVPRQQKEQND